LNEEVLKVVKLAQKEHLSSPLNIALDAAHSVAFHRGLGDPLYANLVTPYITEFDAEGIAQFSEKVYTKENIAVVANGATQSDFAKWVGQFFGDVQSGSKESSPASKYYGGEARIAHSAGNVLLVGFEGSSSFTSGSTYKPEIAVLTALLGGQSTIKWSPGFSLLSKAADAFPGVQVATQHAAYSDAGLLYITFSGNAAAIKKASQEAVETLKKVAAGDVKEEDMKKAIAVAKFRALEAGEQTEAGLEATGNGLIQGGKPFQIDEIGSSIDKVTGEQVKNVSNVLDPLPRTCVSDIYPGGEDVAGQQSLGIGSGRPVCAALRRGDWPEGLSEEWKRRTLFPMATWRCKTCKYQIKSHGNPSLDSFRIVHPLCISGGFRAMP
jgi:ubiquinol-cytochrome c reductase core subunit 2